MIKNIVSFLGRFILFSAVLFILWLPFYAAYLSLVYDLAEIFFGFTHYAKFAVSISVSEASETSEVLTPLIPFIAMALAVNKLKPGRTFPGAALLLVVLSLAAFYLNLSYAWWILALLSLLILIYGIYVAGVSKNNYLKFLALGCFIIILFQVLTTTVYIQSVTIESVFNALQAQGYDASDVYTDYKNSTALLGILRPLEVIIPLLLGITFMFMYSDIVPKLRGEEEKTGDRLVGVQGDYIKFMKDLQ